MTAPDTTSPVADAASAPVVYEQPLNERMRMFLRLDFLYSRRSIHQERADSWAMRAAMGSFLDILAITARNDIRSEVLKELERQMAVMHEYQARPGVDAGRLKAVLSNLARLRTELNSAGALFMQRLRDSEFLNAIKHQDRSQAGRANSISRTIGTGSKNPWRCAPRPSRNGSRRSGRCATRLPSCCG